MSTDVAGQAAHIAQIQKSIVVAEQSSFIALLNPDLRVSEQVAHVVQIQKSIVVAGQTMMIAIFPGTRATVAGQSAFLGIFNTTLEPRRRRTGTIITDFD